MEVRYEKRKDLDPDGSDHGIAAGRLLRRMLNISSSEIKLSAVIAQADADCAVLAVHEKYFGGAEAFPPHP